MDEPSITDLRWLVSVAKRTQQADSGTGIAEAYADVMNVHAGVVPIQATTFYEGAQVDMPITHFVTIRWLDWLDTTHVIIRRSLRLDGTPREEIFRIRRVKEINGRKRFLEMECELEKRA